MKVAIVGTSHLKTDQEKRDVKRLCATILSKYEAINTTIVTGGAIGVDSIAQEVGLILGFAIKPIFPMGFGWEANKLRNLEIVDECDKLFCISIPVHDKKCYHHDPPQDHEKTAGCWTMKMALQAGKQCRLLVTPKWVKGQHK